jgi:hypothetical protein
MRSERSRSLAKAMANKRLGQCGWGGLRGGRGWIVPRASAVEEFGPVVDVPQDCGFSRAVEFASLRAGGSIMLRMSADAPAGLVLLITSHVHARRTQTGPARRSSRGKLCVPLRRGSQSTIQAFGCSGDAAGSPLRRTVGYH